MQRTPKDRSKIKQVETGNQSKLLIDDENLTKILKQLLEGDSSLLHNAVTENLRDNNCLANNFTTSEICEKDLPMLINKVVKNDNFINGVVEKLTEALLQNVEFNTALNLEIEKKVLDATAAQNEMYEKKFSEMQEEFEKLAQYSRRNCLIIHGIEMKSGENTNEICKNFFETSLGIKINNHDIDRSHRLGRFTATLSASKTSHPNHMMNPKPKPIIIKFTRHDIKSEIYLAKRKLAKTSFMITECLTRERQRCIKLLKQLKDKKAIFSFWTMDGNLYYTKEMNGQKFSVTSIMKAIQNGLNT